MPLVNTLRRFAIALVGACICCSSWALNPELAINQFHHTSWLARDGAPSNIYRIAQTKDGYLWLGTATGLFRFDGKKFEKFAGANGGKLLSNGIYALRATPDGGLWVGYIYGGVSFIRNGEITHYQRGATPAADSFPDRGTIRDIAIEADGTVWALSETLNVLRDGRFQIYSTDLPRSAGSSMKIDTEGGVWAALKDGIYRRAAGAKRFERIYEQVGTNRFVEGKNGIMWVVTERARMQAFKIKDGSMISLDRAAAENVYPGYPVITNDGDIWVAGNGGVQRIARPEKLLSGADPKDSSWFQVTKEEDGLSGDDVPGVFADREGNIWLGTNGGLDRLREARVTPVMTPASKQGGAAYFALEPGADGSMWVGAWDAGLLQVKSDAKVFDPKLMNIYVLHRGGGDRLWIGGRHQFWLREHGVTKPVAWPAGFADPVPQAMQEMPDGSLWVAFIFDGVHRYKNGVWERMIDEEKYKKSTAYAMAADPQGRLWISYGQNRLFRVEKGNQLHEFGEADGAAAGIVSSILVKKDYVWMGGTVATMGFDGSKFTTLTGADGHPFTGVSGLVETDDGDLWMNGSDGITHITAAEINRWKKDAKYQVAFEILDHRDGVVGLAHPTRPLPTAALASDGRIWFATSKRVLVLDPRHTLHNKLAPPVAVTHVRLDGQNVPLQKPIALTPEMKRIEIDYAALSLAVPERNRYRYRLVGVDRDWQQAGDRSEVAYTNLAPDSYRFQVSASNNDGVWNEEGATLRFDVQPAFYQTVWFRTGAVLVALLLLWMAHRLRVRQLTARAAELLKSQQVERMRIARELHDTLLQGVGSLSMVVRSAIAKAGPDSAATPLLTLGLQHAEEVMADGRTHVAALRADASDGVSIVDELSAFGRELARDSATVFDVTFSGTPRSLSQPAAEDVCKIVREAVWNAFQHAQARSVTLAFDFGRRSLVVQVADDGVGLPKDVVEKGGRDGHWGLTGMHERAVQIGAKLLVRSANGTCIRLTVPAKIAYEAARSRRGGN